MLIPSAGAAAVAGSGGALFPVVAGGALLSGFGSILGGSSSAKEQKRMRQFLERIYNDYINSPLYTGSRDFALSLLREGDFQNIYRNSLLEGLERNKANILAGERVMQDRAARGGYLRGGQMGDLQARARETGFQADRQAYRDYGEQQMQGKLTGAQLAESLAKGPFQAGSQIASQMFNPQLAYQNSPWTTLGQLGSQVGNLGGYLYGQDMAFNRFRNLLG